ncbi:hypothetical protein L2K70_18290 [Nocardioides KLBMP 9356]|uniref:Secreted protein n=1 Tax=Nocardioides potassii TaxID=2911371 RepID=A0ABS9HHG0_9ACTN|nr:hypothetical protein [Nocardioides potassii]MCF6379566.1 hypothetical protein [Nocardioides potassii]
MTTIKNATTGLGRAIAVGAALATLSVGALAASSPAASAHVGSLSLRSHGDDDPAGDDNGGRTGGSDDDGTHDSTDDNGGTRTGGSDDDGTHGSTDDSTNDSTNDSTDDNGGTRSGGGGDDRVIRTGGCSGSADWKLKVKTDGGRLEVEGEIDSNVAGQQWRWTLRHNGSVSDRGTGTTAGRSGSFDVERRIVDLAGADAIAFRAVRDGQVCRGVVNY